MKHEQLRCDGWEAFTAALLSVIDETAYLVVWDRSDAGASENLGRFDLDEADSGSTDDEPDPPEPSHLDDTLGSALNLSAPPSDPAFEGPESGDSDSDERFEAAAGWVYNTLASRMQGESWGRFRVRLYPRNGTRVLKTCTLVVQNSNADSHSSPLEPQPDSERIRPTRHFDFAQQTAKPPPVPRPAEWPAMPPLPLPASPPMPLIPHSNQGLASLHPSENSGIPGAPAAWGAMLQPLFFHEQAQYGAALAYRNLGDCYSQLGQILMSNVTQMQAVMNQTNADLATQVREGRSQLDQLIAAVLEGRVNEIEQKRAAQESMQSDVQRTVLAQHAIQQLGETAKAFFVARSIPSELSETLSAMSSSPELMSVLNQPMVKELMKDPQNLNMLAGTLQQFAQMNAAAAASNQMNGQPGHAGHPAQPPAPDPSMPPPPGYAPQGPPMGGTPHQNPPGMPHPPGGPGVGPGYGPGQQV